MEDNKTPGPGPEVENIADKFGLSAIFMGACAITATLTFRYSPEFFPVASVTGIGAVDQWRKGWAALEKYRADHPKNP